MSGIRYFLVAMMALVFVAGCASSQQKQRKEQRDKLAQSSRLYCEFVNGEQNPDIDVALNLEVAQKCDFEHPVSMTSYKTPSEISGIMFCCAMQKPQGAVIPAKTETPVGKSVEKPETSKDSKSGAKSEVKADGKSDATKSGAKTGEAKPKDPDLDE